MENKVKSIKRLKKEKAMFNNMETFLKTKNCKIEKIQLNLEPSKEEDKENFHPEYNLLGSFNTETKFIINVSETELNTNGNYQVNLLINIINTDNYVTFLPNTNSQLFMFISQSNFNSIEILDEPELEEEIISETKDEKKPSKDKKK